MTARNIAVLAAAMALSVNANAATFGDGGTALQGVLDGITTNPVGASSIDVTTDELDDFRDDVWSVGGSGGNLSTIIIELAGFAAGNTFGIYDVDDPSKTVELFGGAASTGSQVLLSILLDGSVVKNFSDTGIDFGANRFGYYLDATAGAGGGFWYSDTALNSDGGDHMYAYQGVGDEIQIGGFAPGPWNANEWVLAWEDLDFGSSDKDFTDFVVLAESVAPAPAPAALALVGLSLLGAGVARRRK